MTRTIVCIGGGPASFFAALRAKAKNPDAQVTILEATGRVLTKVKISGGGRCNVTHNLDDPRRVASHYPRGAKELVGPLHRFGPRETVRWFEERGVPLKAEADGRMFPTTDCSSTIIDCLQREAEQLGVEVMRGAFVRELRREAGGYRAILRSGKEIVCHGVFIGTGSMPLGHQLAESLGHTITRLAPSLFTFCTNDPLIDGLSGIAFERVDLQLEAGETRRWRQSGPMLITHWGVSGPAVLKLSAFAARELQDADYRGVLTIDFLTDLCYDQLLSVLREVKDNNPRKKIANVCPLPLPNNFWKKLCTLIVDDKTWAQLSRQETTTLLQNLKRYPMKIHGKGEFKEEFVTCGGVALSEVDFRTMESKLSPGLFFGGEILDIDGITGGFNFQAAWTGGFIAGESM